MYKIKDVVSRFMFKEFQEIPKNRLWEFIGPIITLEDEEILKTWMRHFKDTKTPHIVVKRNNTQNDADYFYRSKYVKWLICERKV